MSPYSCLSFPQTHSFKSSDYLSIPPMMSWWRPNYLSVSPDCMVFPLRLPQYALSCHSTSTHGCLGVPQAASVSSGFLSVALPPLPSAPPTTHMATSVDPKLPRSSSGVPQCLPGASICPPGCLHPSLSTETVIYPLQSRCPHRLSKGHPNCLSPSIPGCLSISWTASLSPQRPGFLQLPQSGSILFQCPPPTFLLRDPTPYPHPSCLGA